MNFLKPHLLFHPPLPKPMHGLNPRTIMGQAWWDEKRNEAAEKNNQCCWACGIPKQEAKYRQWLEGHESYIIDYENGIMELDEIVSLCHSCHNYIHSGLLKIKLHKGEINEDQYEYIIQRGNFIIKKLPTPPILNLENEEKNFLKWQLRIDSEVFSSLFKNEQEWYEYYNR